MIRWNVRLDIVTCGSNLFTANATEMCLEYPSMKRDFQGAYSQG